LLSLANFLAGFPADFLAYFDCGLAALIGGAVGFIFIVVAIADRYNKK
jgi:hypothetical protein